MNRYGLLARCAPVALIALALSVGARAQFNCDLDDPGSPPFAGGGTPSSAFGAAANQPGYWNSLNAAGFGPTALRNLSGQLTNVICTGPSGGIGSGFNFAGNTGDYALLLNDGHQVYHDSWTFTGLAPGIYRLYTYAVWPNGVVTATAVTVPGSFTVNPQYVTGPMPGNRFDLNVTHSIHEIQVSTGNVTVNVDRGGHFGFVNGFQIVPVAVPEPSIVLGLILGLLSIATCRRKRRTR